MNDPIKVRIVNAGEGKYQLAIDREEDLVAIVSLLGEQSGIRVTGLADDKNSGGKPPNSPLICLLEPEKPWEDSKCKEIRDKLEKVFQERFGAKLPSGLGEELDRLIVEELSDSPMQRDPEPNSE